MAELSPRESPPGTAAGIRRTFAEAWGRIGAAWGVAPSTAAVQGYLLLHGGPLTEAELQRALGLSHRATRVALTDCETWGIVERSPEPRRSGRRGPAGTAWVAVDDHWEWFRRVAGARKVRETDPVLPVLEECLAMAQAAPAEDQETVALRARLTALIEFVRAFDRALSSVVRSDSAALAHLFGVARRLDDASLDGLLVTLATIPEDDLVNAARALSRLPPSTVARVVRLLGRPGLARVIAAVATRDRGQPRTADTS